MKIKWEKLPERLHSEALKCLLCNVMKSYASSHKLMEGLAHCAVYMTQALVTEDDEAFTKDGKALMKSLEGRLFVKADEPTKKEIESFLTTHSEYIRERTQEVLERATKCPEFKTKERR